MHSVVNRFSLGKYGDEERNEDSVVATPWFCAVIDGATSKSGWAGPVSPGRRIARIIAEGIEGFSSDLDARAAVDTLTQIVAGARSSSQQAEIPAASVLIFSAAREEVWVVGDGWMVCDGQVSRFGHEIEQRAAAARAALLRVELRRRSVPELLADDPGRAMILPLLQDEGLMANLAAPEPLAFGRLDGTPVPDSFVRVHALPPEWRRVVLASDGYPAMAPTLAEAEALLASRIHDDPLMICDPPATKGVGPGQVSFDDRSWLEIARD